MKVSRDQLFEFDFEVSQMRITLEQLLTDQPWIIKRYESFMASIRGTISR